MAKNNLLKESIVEANKMREAAIKLAKTTLQESLTTQIQRKFASKLDEEMDSETDLNEDNDISDEEMESLMKEVFGDNENLFESEEPEYNGNDDEDDFDLDEILREIDDNDEKKKDDKKSEKEPKKDDKESKEPKKDPKSKEDDKKDKKDSKENDKKPAPKKPKDEEEDISNMTPEDLEELIREIVREETQGEAGEGNELPNDDLGLDSDIDMNDTPEGGDDLGDMKGLDGGDDIDLGDLGTLKDKKDKPEDELKEEEELDLDELLREIDDEDFEMGDPGISDEDNYDEENLMESNKFLKKTLVTRTNYLNEAIETIRELNKEIKEINLLNSKLLYVNKIFKNKSLNESQKSKIIDAFDKAETSNEAKLIYEAIQASSFSERPNPKNLIKENLSIASKPIGMLKESKNKEQDPTIQRFQKLAGIK